LTGRLGGVELGGGLGLDRPTIDSIVNAVSVLRVGSSAAISLTTTGLSLVLIGLNPDYIDKLMAALGNNSLPRTIAHEVLNSVASNPAALCMFKQILTSDDTNYLIIKLL